MRFWSGKLALPSPTDPRGRRGPGNEQAESASMKGCGCLPALELPAKRKYVADGMFEQHLRVVRRAQRTTNVSAWMPSSVKGSNGSTVSSMGRIASARRLRTADGILKRDESSSDRSITLGKSLVPSGEHLPQHALTMSMTADGVFGRHSRRAP
jgi:hypothetical protein